MVKKLIATGATVATILAMAGGAFAYTRGHHSRGNANVGVVYGNNVVAVANTGLNHQYGGDDQDMDTGDALATAGQDNVVNSSTCGCENDRRGRRGHSSTTNIGVVADNNVVAVANTGLNEQQGDVEGPATFSRRGHHGHNESEQDMDTGDADAFAWQTNVVNSSTHVEAE